MITYLLSQDRLLADSWTTWLRYPLLLLREDDMKGVMSSSSGKDTNVEIFLW